MNLPKELKARIAGEYQTKEGDTGSPEVQVALLTRRIEGLTGHFATHTHDHHSRQGLLRLVRLRGEEARGRDLPVSRRGRRSSFRETLPNKCSADATLPPS